MTLLLLACFRTTEPKPVTEPPPVTLGWKWVPGDSLNVELSSQASIEGQTVTRLESWEYLVREVDHEGVATLEGRLTGLGAQVTRKGETLTERETRLAREAEMERAEPVKLRIAMDGRLADLKGANWSDSLAHRLLALQLSQEPIEPGDMWPDPVVARPYADLMPVELELTVEGYHTLDGLYELDGTVLLLMP